VAFAAAETEEAGIVADEGDAFAGVARLRAEIARLDSSHINQSACVLNRIDRDFASYLILAVVLELLFSLDSCNYFACLLLNFLAKI
jgi:hypothetical protein